MPDWLDQKRAKIFNDEDRELYLHLGYFLSWFSAEEAQLTLLIAFLCVTTQPLAWPRFTAARAP